ncbi:Glucose/Sorbosone dehydrogenase [Candidatus Methylopumilus planktonicus]|uniref:PQQ-dependent sugar dehydrogenase n=1 Tax=Candidatus Methylopumilus planktonicus TaxID=1581557 RepID=UPI003BEEEAAE
MKKKIAALLLFSLALFVISVTRHLQRHNQELSLEGYLETFHISKKNSETNECAAIQKEISFYSIGCKKIKTSEIISNNPNAKYSGIFKLKGILHVLTSDGNIYIKNDEDFHFLKKLDLLNLDTTYFGGLLNSIFLPEKNLLVTYSLNSISQNKYLLLTVFDAKNFKKVNQIKLTNTKTLPSQLGGGMAFDKENLYLSIGVASQDFVDNQSQEGLNPNSLYGKIVSIPLNQIEKKIKDINIFSSGHKHLQGLLKTKNAFIGVEHSVEDGDEINLLNYQKNYGYNDFGYTKHHMANKNTYYFNKNRVLYQDPIFYFTPEAALSDIEKCVFDEFENNYAYNPCIIVSSLAQQSIFIIKFKRERNAEIIPKNPIVINTEKIQIGERVRKVKNLNEKNGLFVLTDSLNIFFLTFVTK